MTVQPTGSDPEACDECGSRHCVLRPIRRETGDVEFVCGLCFVRLDDRGAVDRVDFDWVPVPSQSCDLEEYNPAGCDEFAIMDPENPRERHIHGKPVDLEKWR